MILARILFIMPSRLDTDYLTELAVRSPSKKKKKRADMIS
jgi:hypothetical protein